VRAIRRGKRAGQQDLKGEDMLAGFDGVLVVALALKKGPVVGVDGMAVVALTGVSVDND
jgi:hypothetical protein